MHVWAIGDVARQANVAASAIRYYESIGLLPPPARVNGRRRYDETVLRKLGVIRLAQQAGLTIAEIHALLNDFSAVTPPSERWQRFAGDKLVEVSERISQLEQMKSLLESMLDCACSTLEDCGTPRE